jgi:predicted Zn-dependent protease
MPLLALAPLLGLLHACATNPVTGEQDFVLMSEQQEIELGQRYHQQILEEMPAYQDPALAAYVDSVGQRVARASHRPDLVFRFTVIDDTSVNAFALPGGYIYITRGLLAYLNSEAELAAVLGHEVGHVTARHSVRQHSAATVAGVAGTILQATTGVRGSQDLFNILGTALLRGYGREHELESDRLGAQYLARTGYDPQAMLNVIGVLKDQELFDRVLAEEEGREPRAYHGLFSTHPDNDRRLQEVVGEAGRLTGSAPVTHDGREAFLQQLQGLTFGDSERQGIVRDHRFLHGPLDFGLAVPPGWRIENRPERLIITAPDGDAMMEMRMEPMAKRISPREYLEEKGGGRIRSGRTLDVAGFRAYSATAPVSTSAGRRTARVIVLYDSDNVFTFTGVSRDAGQRSRFDAGFEAIARSYHKLSADEQQLARGLELQLITAGAGTRFAELARNSPIARHAESQLRLLNDLYPDGEPTPGQTLKIVE